MLVLLVGVLLGVVLAVILDPVLVKIVAEVKKLLADDEVPPAA